MTKSSKRTNRRFILWLSIALFLGHIIGLSAVQSDPAAMPQLAPLNPAFVEWMRPGIMVQRAEPAETQRALGYIPPPVDLSHLTVRDDIRLFRSSVSEQPLPSRYDLRELGRVTPARDQGDCGACWAFATMGSLESNLLPEEEHDFSENHLKNTSGFVWGPCAGGNYFMSTAYLARWSGPVNETDDPYHFNSAFSPAGLTAQKQVQSVWIIPDRVPGTGGNTRIKQAVMNHGAVSTVMYSDNSYYRATTRSYFYNGTASANHGVLIVGWDDDFPAADFNTAPPGNGAFIIQNSWGGDWGEQGHFYISYYDAVIGQHNFIFNNAEQPSRYSAIYQHDTLGWSGSTGYIGLDTAWAANIFTAQDHEVISAIGFYTTAANATYTGYIYTQVTGSPRSGQLAAGPISGGFTFAGYHTVELPEPVAVTAGQTFSVVLEMTTPGHISPIAIETPISGFSAPTAGPGESFISANGTSWSDITTMGSFVDTNVCIKAYAQIGSADLAISKTTVSATAAVGEDLIYTITVTNNGPNSAAGVTLLDALPSELDSVSVTPSQGTCSGGRDISCALGILEAGEQAVVTLVATPNTTGAITNIATVEAATDDPITTNNTASAEVQVDHPEPLIDRLSPAEAIEGATGTTLVIEGSGFVPTSVVRIDGVDRATVFVSYERLTLQLASADTADTGILNINVYNPPPAGGLSNEATLTVVDPPAAESEPRPSGGGGGDGGGGGGGCFISSAAPRALFR